MQTGTGRGRRSGDFRLLSRLRSGETGGGSDDLYVSFLELEVLELGIALDEANDRADTVEALAVEFRQEVLDAVVNLNEALWPNGEDPADDLTDDELFEGIGANGTD